MARSSPQSGRHQQQLLSADVSRSADEGGQRLYQLHRSAFGSAILVPVPILTFNGNRVVVSDIRFERCLYVHLYSLVQAEVCCLS